MAEHSRAPTPHPVTAWVLAGGEGRRMGGLDKGLQPWRGQPLVSSVLKRILPQSQHLGISANRNLATYGRLLTEALAERGQAIDATSLGVHADHPDLPARSGPLAGMLTGLRESPTDWVQFAACDTPQLPAHLIEVLMRAASQAQADIAVPSTQERGRDGRLENHLHWTCALTHKRVTTELVTAFVKGDRKVGQWIQSQRWVAVSFPTASDFENMNTLETLDDRA